MGFEPTTPGLKVRSSTAELRAPKPLRSYLFRTVPAIFESPVIVKLPPKIFETYLPPALRIAFSSFAASRWMSGSTWL